MPIYRIHTQLFGCFLCLLLLICVGQAKPNAAKHPAKDIVFLTYKSFGPSGFMAGGPGTVMVVNGCIRLTDSNGNNGTTMVFPSSFSYRIIKGKLELIYQGKVYAREGDKVVWGGFPAGDSAPGNEKIFGDTSRCPGPFWFL